MRRFDHVIPEEREEGRGKCKNARKKKLVKNEQKIILLDKTGKKAN